MGEDVVAKGRSSDTDLDSNKCNVFLAHSAPKKHFFMLHFPNPRMEPKWNPELAMID